MAKGRRPSRSKKHPPVLSSSAESRQDAASARAADRAETEDLAARLIALRSEVSEARAGAEARSKPASRGRFRRGGEEAVAAGSGDVFYGAGVADVVDKDPRRRWLAALIAVLAAVAVLLGLIVAGNTGSKKSTTDPVAAYLNSHVPSGMSIGVVGGLTPAIPASFSPVQVDGPTSVALQVLKYIVAPNPSSTAGAMSGWLAQNTKKVAVGSNGATALYAVQSISATKPTVPVTTHTTTPVTHPVSTAPPPTTAVTAPATTAVTTPATVPATTPATAPATTPSTTPLTTVPTTTVTVPPSGGGGTGSTATNGGGGTSTSGSGSGSSVGTATPAGTFVVPSGSSFWSIAAAQVQKQLGATPTTAQIGHYWAQLVAANLHNLPHPGDPNLIFAGQTIVLPAG